MTVLNAKWTGRADPLFAECAEALGIATDNIMAALPRDALNVMVMFTPELDESDPLVWSALLCRGRDRVLHEAQRTNTGKRFSEMIESGPKPQRVPCPACGSAIGEGPGCEQCHGNGWVWKVPNT